MGSEGVGKSALAVQLTARKFITDYDPTLEDIYSKKANVHTPGMDSFSILLSILDTAGQPEHSAFRETYIRKGEGFIIVYDITSRPSFIEAVGLHGKLREAKGNVPCVLIGNKVDLTLEKSSTRMVSYEEGAAVAQFMGDNVVFCELSAKSNSLVENVFTELLCAMLKCRLKDLDKNDSKFALTLDNTIPKHSLLRKSSVISVASQAMSAFTNSIASMKISKYSQDNEDKHSMNVKKSASDFSSLFDRKKSEDTRTNTTAAHSGLSKITDSQVSTSKQSSTKNSQLSASEVDPRLLSTGKYTIKQTIPNYLTPQPGLASLYCKGQSFLASPYLQDGFDFMPHQNDILAHQFEIDPEHPYDVKIPPTPIQDRKRSMPVPKAMPAVHLMPRSASDPSMHLLRQVASTYEQLSQCPRNEFYQNAQRLLNPSSTKKMTYMQTCVEGEPSTFESSSATPSSQSSTTTNLFKKTFSNIKLRMPRKSSADEQPLSPLDDNNDLLTQLTPYSPSEQKGNKYFAQKKEPCYFIGSEPTSANDGK